MDRRMDKARQRQDGNNFSWCDRQDVVFHLSLNKL